MDNRIIRDIRYFEIKPEDFIGEFDGLLGNVYSDSPDTKFIGQRIARKLNEFGFISGEFDHIYINLLRDDQSGGYFILYYPERNVNASIYPLGGYDLACDYFAEMILIGSYEMICNDILIEKGEYIK